MSTVALPVKGVKMGVLVGLAGVGPAVAGRLGGVDLTSQREELVA